MEKAREKRGDARGSRRLGVVSVDGRYGRGNRGDERGGRRGGAAFHQIGWGSHASRARRSVLAASLRAQRMADSIPRPKWFLRSPDETCGRAPVTWCERVSGDGDAVLGRTDGGRQKEIHQWARLDGLAGDHRGVGGDTLALFTVNITGIPVRYRRSSSRGCTAEAEDAQKHKKVPKMLDPRATRGCRPRRTFRGALCTTRCEIWCPGTDEA